MKRTTSAYNINLAQGKEREKYKTKVVITINPIYACPIHKGFIIDDICEVAGPACKALTRIATANFNNRGDDWDLSYRCWKALRSEIPAGEAQEDRLREIEKKIADIKTEITAWNAAKKDERTRKKNFAKKQATSGTETRTKKSARLSPGETFVEEENSQKAEGLVHRWSFNGDAKDSVGGADAEIHEGVLVNGQCILQGGWISLNRAAPAFADSFTVEVWVTELKSDLGACVFRMMYDWDGNYERNILRWATAEASACTGWIHAHMNDGSWFESGRAVLGRVTIGEEYYAAVTVHKTDDGFEIVAYRYVPKTGEWFRWSERRHNQELMKIEQFELGPKCCTYRKFANISGSYNECRVWARCLSRAEIENSAKSGPDDVNGLKLSEKTGRMQFVKAAEESDDGRDEKDRVIYVFSSNRIFGEAG